MATDVGYRQAVNGAGAKPLLVLSVVGRFASGLVPFGIVATLTSDGHVALAGIASGVYLYVSALAGPTKGRLVDSNGLRALIGLATAFMAMCLAFVVAAGSSLEGMCLIVVPLLALTAPPAAPVLRTMWATISADDATRRRLHALDSVLEETTFALSPLLVALVWATAGARFAVLAGGVTAALAVAGFSLLATRRNLDLRKPRSAGRGRRRISWLALPPATWLILLPMLTVGFAMGSVGALSPEWSRSVGMGAGEASGFVLALISAAGVVAGLVHGRVFGEGGDNRQFLVGGILLAIGTFLFAVPGTFLTGIVGAILIGTAMTPMFTLAYVLVPDVVGDAAGTQVNASIGSAFNISAALGASVGGVLAATTSIPITFLVVGGIGTVLVIAAQLAWRRLAVGVDQSVVAR